MGSWGGNVGGSVSMGTPSVESYQEGRLVIHVADAAKNQEVWYGTITGKVDRQSLDADAVARAVALAMEGFPARAAARRFAARASARRHQHLVDEVNHAVPGAHVDAP